MDSTLKLRSYIIMYFMEDGHPPSEVTRLLYRHP